MKQTKIEMVKDIFFAATVGQRTPRNYPDGMYVIETIANHNNKEYIKFLCEELDGTSIVNITATSRRIFGKLVDSTYSNTCGANGFTKTSISFLQAANKFL